MKCLIAVLFGSLAFACTIGCGWLVDWIWTVKQPTIDKTTVAFKRVEDVLNVAHQTLDDVRANLEASRAQVNVLRTSSTVEPKKQPDFVQTMLAGSIVKQLSTNIDDVRHTIENVTEASIVVNSILESLQGLENVENLDVNQIRSLQTQLGGVTKASWDLGDLLESQHPGEPSTAADKSARIGLNLEQIIRVIGEFQQKTAALQNKIRRYKHETLYWMTRGPTIATYALAWVAISQIVVIGVAVRTLRREVHGDTAAAVGRDAQAAGAERGAR